MAEFYEEKEITGVRVIEGDMTPAGGQMVELAIKDGTPIRMTGARYKAMVSAEKSDASKARAQLVQEVGGKIYAMLMEYGVLLPEVDHCFDMAINLVNNAIERSQNVLWGVDAAHQRSLLMVNDVLKKAYGQQSAAPKDGPAS
jgi:hypothetical protein